MISLHIPGWRDLQLEHLVLDYNGTLAIDGRLIADVEPILRELSRDLEVHVITADTFGTAASGLAGLALQLVVLAQIDQATAKASFVGTLGVERVVAIGNGRNDRAMLQAAALGIAVLQREGAAAETIASADLVASSIGDALDLLRNPKRLVATLRS
ncbi:MAG TPA: HAD hydrolase family protein [Casimicrobiaceae bacterium]|nr:HAD hydrolase family protein [Casimicrobiaceae bacterium]